MRGLIFKATSYSCRPICASSHSAPLAMRVGQGRAACVTFWTRHSRARGPKQQAAVARDSRRCRQAPDSEPEIANDAGQMVSPACRPTFLTCSAGSLARDDHRPYHCAGSASNVAASRQHQRLRTRSPRSRAAFANRPSEIFSRSRLPTTGYRTEPPASKCERSKRSAMRRSHHLARKSCGQRGGGWQFVAYPLGEVAPGTMSVVDCHSCRID